MNKSSINEEIMKRMYVQYGAGWSNPRGWKNFDASPTLRFERMPILGSMYQKNKNRFPDNIDYGDIVKGLPIKEMSCDGVYCSHVLEHLTLNDFRTALRNTYKILKKNGRFRMVLPDLEYEVSKYMQDTTKEAAHEFMRNTYLGMESRRKGLTGFLISWLGNSSHLWMWDFKSIEAELISAGFIEIRRASFGDSLDSKFLEVEEQDRWTNCLGVECKK